MKKQRITLCGHCYNLLKTQKEIKPIVIEGEAIYIATGYCGECKKRGSVRRFEITGEATSVVMTCVDCGHWEPAEIPGRRYGEYGVCELCRTANLGFRHTLGCQVNAWAPRPTIAEALESLEAKESGKA